MSDVRSTLGNVPDGAKGQLEDFTFAFPQSELDDLTAALRASREVEADVNTIPNYKIALTHENQDYTLHFCALFSQSLNATPVLLLHDWPGSFLEFVPIPHLLTKKYTPSALPYHLMVPSLPGYALSSPTSSQT